MFFSLMMLMLAMAVVGIAYNNYKKRRALNRKNIKQTFRDCLLKTQWGGKLLFKSHTTGKCYYIKPSENITIGATLNEGKKIYSIDGVPITKEGNFYLYWGFVGTSTILRKQFTWIDQNEENKQIGDRYEYGVENYKIMRYNNIQINENNIKIISEEKIDTPPTKDIFEIEL